MITQTENSILILEATYLLKKHFNCSIAIKKAFLLSKPQRRNTLIRLILKDNATNIRSVILKQSSWDRRDESKKGLLERFVHEWAGLKFLNKVSNINHVVPKFFGGNYQHKFILLEDFDARISV